MINNRTHLYLGFILASENIRKTLLELFNSKFVGEGKYHLLSRMNWHRYMQQIIFLSHVLPAKAKILDLGCGYGHTTAMLRSLRPDIEATGIDIIQYESWNILSETYACRYSCRNAESTGFPDDSFDHLIAFGLLEHVDDKGFLIESNRIVKPGGSIFIFNLPNILALSENIAEILGMWHHDRRYSEHGIKILLGETKWQAIRISKEFVVPSQFNRISSRLQEIFDHNIRWLEYIDAFLVKGPFRTLAQSFFVQAKKANIRSGFAT